VYEPTYITRKLLNQEDRFADYFPQLVSERNYKYAANIEILSCDNPNSTLLSKGDHIYSLSGNSDFYRDFNNHTITEIAGQGCLFINRYQAKTYNFEGLKTVAKTLVSVTEYALGGEEVRLLEFPGGYRIIEYEGSNPPQKFTEDGARPATIPEVFKANNLDFYKLYKIDVFKERAGERRRIEKRLR